MTEMAPIGYVGISPKCVLGFNTVMETEVFVGLLYIRLALSLADFHFCRIKVRRYLCVLELTTLRVSGSMKASRKLFCMNL